MLEITHWSAPGSTTIYLDNNRVREGVNFVYLTEFWIVLVIWTMAIHITDNPGAGNTNLF